MKPLGAPFDHPLAFCGELAKVGGEHGRCDNGARHGVRVGRSRDSVAHTWTGVSVDLRDLPISDSTDSSALDDGPFVRDQDDGRYWHCFIVHTFKITP